MKEFIAYIFPFVSCHLFISFLKTASNLISVLFFYRPHVDNLSHSGLLLGSMCPVHSNVGPGQVQLRNPTLLYIEACKLVHELQNHFWCHPLSSCSKFAVTHYIIYINIASIINILS